MDIVYLVKECQQDEELTYSLRSLCNLPHDKVFIVGGCPENIDKNKVIHISCLQTGTKYKNTTRNLLRACNDARLSDDFILMNDDFFILKKIENPKDKLNLCRGTISEVLKEYQSRYSYDANSYISGMRQTEIFLKDLGIQQPLSYELHIPFVMNKKKFLKMLEMKWLDAISVLHKRSLYGNLFLTNSKKVNDVKLLKKRPDIVIDKFLSTEDNSFAIVKPMLEQKFADKSIYEI